MNKETDPKRNEPAEKGKKKDPDVRDDSAIEPGVQTVSKSDYDEANQKLTKTASDNFDEDLDNNGADAAFDDMDKE